MLRQTFTDVSFYKEIPTLETKLSIKFFLLSMLLLGLFRTARFVKVTVPQNKQLIEQSLTEIETYYPEDVLIEWDTQILKMYHTDATNGGKSAINEYKFTYPATFSEEKLQESGFPENFGAYINQDVVSTEPNESAFSNTFFLLTQKEFLINSAQNEWQAFPYQDLPGADQAFQIDKTNIADVTQMAKNTLFGALQMIQELSWLVLPLLTILFRVFSTAVLALFALFLARINTLQLSYKNVFQISLHLAVVAESIDFLIMLLYPNQHLSWFSLSFWILFFYVLLTWKKESKIQ